MPTLHLEEQFLRGFANFGKDQVVALRQRRSRHSAQMPVDELLATVAQARLELSSRHMQIGDLLLRSAEFRGAIGRFYYAMYHAARTVVFVVEAGDDYESHGNLPVHLPGDMPERSARVRSLEDGRLLRNEADYDPFPVGDAHWESDARRLAADAAEFCRACDDYLAQRTLEFDDGQAMGATDV